MNFFRKNDKFYYIGKFLFICWVSLYLSFFDLGLQLSNVNAESGIGNATSIEAIISKNKNSSNLIKEQRIRAKAKNQSNQQEDLTYGASIEEIVIYNNLTQAIYILGFFIKGKDEDLIPTHIANASEWVAMRVQETAENNNIFDQYLEEINENTYQIEKFQPPLKHQEKKGLLGDFIQVLNQNPVAKKESQKELDNFDNFDNFGKSDRFYSKSRRNKQLAQKQGENTLPNTIDFYLDQINEAYDQSLEIKEKLEQYLSDSQMTRKSKIKILDLYIRQVLIPMREIYITAQDNSLITAKIVGQKYLRLLPRFPAEMIDIDDLMQAKNTDNNVKTTIQQLLMHKNNIRSFSNANSIEEIISNNKSLGQVLKEQNIRAKAIAKAETEAKIQAKVQAKVEEIQANQQEDRFSYGASIEEIIIYGNLTRAIYAHGELIRGKESQSSPGGMPSSSEMASMAAMMGQAPAAGNSGNFDKYLDQINQNACQVEKFNIINEEGPKQVPSPLRFAGKGLLGDIIVALNQEIEVKKEKPVKKTHQEYLDDFDNVVKDDRFFSKSRRKKQVPKKQNKKRLPTTVDFYLNQIVEAYDQSLAIKEKIEQYLSDSQMKRESRLKILEIYISQILIPMRELFIISRINSVSVAKVLGQKYFRLLPTFPTNIIDIDDLIQAKSGDKSQKMDVRQFFIKNYTVKVIAENEKHSRLEFEEFNIHAKDLITLMKVPTPNHYVTALKWMTLDMMIEQIYRYDLMLGNKGKIDIPKGCQTSFNHDLPRFFTHADLYKVEDPGETLLEKFLVNNQMIPEEGSEYYQQYLEGPGKDPLKDNYSEVAPFEQYKSAQMAISEEELHHHIAPQLDDLTYFDAVLNSRKVPALASFHQNIDAQAFRGEPGVAEFSAFVETREYKGIELFKQILAMPDDNKQCIIKLVDHLGKIKKKEISPKDQNLSLYLTEVMIKENVENYTDLFSPELIQQLKDTPIEVPFPSLYSSPAWRQMSYNALYKVTVDNKDISKSSSLYMSFKNACFYYPDYKNSKYRKQICGTGVAINNVHIVNNLSAFLKKLITNRTAYIPLKEIEKKHMQEFYPFLGKLWSELRDNGQILSISRSNEWDYLRNQMRLKSPWARLRVSYLIAIERLQQFNRANQNSCFTDHVDTQEKLMQNAASYLGLNQPLQPFHIDRILNDQEKEAIWDNIREDFSKDSHHLLIAPVEDSEDNYIDLFSEIAYATVIGEDQREKLYSKNPLLSPSTETRGEIANMVSHNYFKHSDLYLKVYKLGANTEDQAKKKLSPEEIKKKQLKIQQEQEALIKDYIKDNPELTFQSIKESFLFHDLTVKKELYKDLLRKSALQRQNKVKETLEGFCKLSRTNDFEDFRAIFISTTKEQNKLNKLAGLPEVPEQITEMMDSYSEDDWYELWTGLGSGGLAMGALIVAFACSAGTSAACSPLAVSAMFAAGAYAAKLQFKLIPFQIERKLHADTLEDLLFGMEQLDMAEEGVAYEISKSWIHTGIEVVALISIFGIAYTGVITGARALFQGGKLFFRNLLAKQTFRKSSIRGREAARTVLNEEEINLAELVLGFSDRWSKAQNMIKEFRSKSRKLRKLHATGGLGVRQLYSKIETLRYQLKEEILNSTGDNLRYHSKKIINYTRDEIDQQTAKVITLYLDNDANALLKILNSYAGEYSKFKFKNGFKNSKLDHAVGVIENIDKEKVGTRWFYKLRYQELRDNAINLRVLIDDLKTFIKNGSVAIGKEQKVVTSFEQLNLEHLENLNKFFFKNPMRKRDFPYAAIQGGPAFAADSIILRYTKKVLGPLAAETILLRKFFNARSRLILEANKSWAQEALGLSPYVSINTAHEFLKSFQRSVEHGISTDATGAINKEYLEFQTLITNNIQIALKDNINLLKNKNFKDAGIDMADNIPHVHATLTQHNSFKQLLFHPKEGSINQSISQVIWESIDFDEILKLKKFDKLLHQATSELRDYKEVDTFQYYINLLIIGIKKGEMGKVEII